MEDKDGQRVMSALLYFVDPKDVIPDQVEVLGFLDDAIMIELCVRELRHELDAYDDFCEYRAHEATKRGVEPATVGQADWLESRREELVDRMHRSEEHTSELQSLMRTSYAVFVLKKKQRNRKTTTQ